MPTAYISRLTDARQVLATISVQANVLDGGRLIPPIPSGKNAAFNPFQQSVTGVASTQSVIPKGNIAQQRKQESAQVAEELAKRKKEIEKQNRPDKNIDDSVATFIQTPKLCWSTDLGNLQDAINKSQLDFVGEDDNDGEILQDMLKCMQGTGAGNFKSREKGELGEVRQKQVHKICVIRIQFPNKMILELTCKPNETVKALYMKVEFIVKQNSDEFYLYQTPPVVKFDATSKKSLGQEQLVPGANLFYGLVNVNPPYSQDPKYYLREEWLNKLPAKKEVLVNNNMQSGGSGTFNNAGLERVAAIHQQNANGGTRNPAVARAAATAVISRLDAVRGGADPPHGGVSGKMAD